MSAKKFFYNLLMIALIIFPTGGIAGDIDGSSFIKNCDLSTINSNMTAGEVSTLIKEKSACLEIALSAFQQVSSTLSNVNFACYKHYYGLENYSSVEIANLLFKYINNNPQTSSHPISALTLDMLQDKFPIPAQCIAK